MFKTTPLILFVFLCFLIPLSAQKKKKTNKTYSPTQLSLDKFKAMKFRNIGPFRGGRSVAVAGVPGDPLTYFFGSTGGGVWKTTDAGNNWKNISDGFFKSGSVGAIAVAQSDANVIYIGMGEHAVRGVMTSHGDGLYKSTDGGETWQHTGLLNSRHIASIQIHPNDPETLWVAVQGALWGPSEDRGVYKSFDGGKNWKKVLYVNPSTGASDLSLDITNPRILYAGLWDHQRFPWGIRSGGEGSGIWKSMDGGETWKPLKKGLPEKMGKVAVDVSPANSQVVYANIESADKKGGVYRSDNGGKTWTQTSNNRITVARAWYYIEIFADSQNENIVYVLNAPVLKSMDGGKTFQRIAVAHTDQHDLWINPQNPQNLILGNDGGATVSFNGGQTWSTQDNQPTAQFYRVITDQRFPYYVYGGQQDNSTVAIPNRTLRGKIEERDWYPVAGGESAFIAFDPKNPQLVYGTSIQGTIGVYDHQSKSSKSIMEVPQLILGKNPEDMVYRFNWNGPLVAQIQDPSVLYHGGNILFKTTNGGLSWTEISPDLTKNEKDKHGSGGFPFTNESAGGEVYNTISYIACSPHQSGEIWIGTDDGLVQLTKDEGQIWNNITPPKLGNALINAIEISTHQPGKAYLAITKYKWDDLSPIIYKTIDFGNTWKNINTGIGADHFVRAVREDPKQSGLLYAGTENGLYLSFDDGENWSPFQSNLPVCPITDLTIQDNDLIVATSGRAFWILDDLSVFQQSSGQPDTTQIQVYQPKPTYKFGGGGGRSSQHAGQNPVPGVGIDYYLPHDFSDSLELKIEILNSAGKIVRTLTNQKDESFKTWEGGPSKPVVISSKPGLNRFHWDLKGDPLPAISNVFVMGGHNGFKVAPGEYQIRLSSPTNTVAAAFNLKPDPNLNASRQDHLEQQQVLAQIENTVKDIHDSVNQFRNVKNQLEQRLQLLAQMENMDDLITHGKSIQKSILEWENNLIQSKQETFQDVINFPNQLNAELIHLGREVDEHDPRVTAGTKTYLKQLLNNWQMHKSEMNTIETEMIGEFNKIYTEKELPVLIIPKKKTTKSVGDP